MKGYDETTKTLKSLVDKSIAGQNLSKSVEALEKATQLHIASQNIPKVSLNIKIRQMEVGKVKAHQSVPMSIEQLNRENKSFNQTSSISFYVNSLL